MTNEECKKLSGFCKALRNMKPVFDERANGRYTIDQETALVVIGVGASAIARYILALPEKK